MKIHRTYPQPDSDAPNIKPRERALATYKYLLDMEPEQAVKHHLFETMVHAFQQAMCSGWNNAVSAQAPNQVRLEPSLVSMLESSREVGG